MTSRKTLAASADHAADRAIRELGGDPSKFQHAIRAFREVIEYISEDPGRQSGKPDKRPNPLEEDGINKLARKYFGDALKYSYPKESSTKPDPLVSTIVGHAFGRSEKELKAMRETHKEAMSAENNVGEYLERYINSKTQTVWSWCAGSFVDKVDFIRRGEDGCWDAVQVKNSSTSENSSSSSVRDGTDISKWHRYHSKKGTTEWSNLPVEFRNFGMSEEGFRRWVIEYLNKSTNAG